MYELQQTNGNINETIYNNIKENITMETENRKTDNTIKSAACKSWKIAKKS